MTASKTAPISLPDDPRVEHRYAILNGLRYHYLYAEPKGQKAKATVFLIHGWPDLSAGWRYQIPLLLELGCRVVAPDMLGYGGTDAPKVPPASIRLYGMKRAADDIVELAGQLGASNIVLGGHDWGGAVIWRTLLWHPELVTHVFSVCTPYDKPTREFRSTEDLVNGPAPQFGYQLHLASGEVEAKVTSKDQIRQFLKGMYGARGVNRESVFSPVQGVLFDNLSALEAVKPKLITSKELDYYVEQYARNGLHGPLNWYRTRKINWEEETPLLERAEITAPALFIQANKDMVLKPEMAVRMGRHFSNLTRGEVNAGHWALWETPDEVNSILRKWFTEQVFMSKTSL